MKSFDVLAAAVSKYHPDPNLELLEKAFNYAKDKHSGQVRASGQEYFDHVFEVALLVSELKLDTASIAAALLHDTIEDCNVSADDIDSLFGDEIRLIVEGVTKLTRIEFESKEEKQAENFRKMLIAMAKDIRVVLVKLCDRLHNMRTLNFLPERKRRVVAQETQDIYAPLANRLGIFWIKSQLEDLCLLYLRPEMHELIKKNLEKVAPQDKAYVEETCRELVQHLKESGISATVYGRSKHLASIFKKMEKDKLPFEEVYDVHGFRVIVPTLRACYEALGVIHSSFRPVPGRFKDYIAMPKPNMYQSLHTTVIGPKGLRIEVQFRTSDMHRVAEEGIAAHWRYKEGSNVPEFDLRWVKDLVETQQYLKNPDEFIQSVKSELFPEEVFVFTPRGDLVRLPYGSSPVDFAYAVHTDVGHHTTGARINGQIVPLSYKLHNGDTIEVMTSKSHVPNKDWLKFVVSTKAKQRIRAFLKSEERARSLAVGMEILSKDLRKVKLSLKKLEQDGKMETVARELGLKGVGDLYAEVGYGKLPSSKILAKVLPEGTDIEAKLKEQASPLQRLFQRAALAQRPKSAIKVSGFDDIILRFAQCCQPLPGDRIVGFISRGRGVIVHHSDCSQVLNADPQRQVEVDWDTGVSSERKVRVKVYCQDSLGMLANLTRAITDHGANIASARAKATGLGKAVNTFELTVKDASQFDSVRRALEMVEGVIKVERLSGFRGENG